MDLLQAIESQKIEQGSVTPITENESVSVQGIEVKPSEVYKAIGDVLENVWLSLTDNMQTDLTSEQITEWVEVCQWACAVMPSAYERQREIVEAELHKWRSFL